MRKFSRDSFNITEAINELMHESGVIVIENAYNLNDQERFYFFKLQQRRSNCKLITNSGLSSELRRVMKM